MVEDFILTCLIVFVVSLSLLMIYKYHFRETFLDESATTAKGQVVSYDPNNYDLTYHEEIAENGLNAMNDISSNSDLFLGGIVSPPRPNYVPNYENSVYLSNKYLSNAIGNLPDAVANNPRGFCQSENTLTQEEKCNRLPKDVCASTECCVLLGGSKCVAGNQHGPLMGSNYSDMFAPYRDFYYYSGECYGNCNQINEPYSYGQYLSPPKTTTTTPPKTTTTTPPSITTTTPPKTATTTPPQKPIKPPPP